jgi:hypothetical protein
MNDGPKRNDPADDIHHRMDSGPAHKPLPKMTINLTSIVKLLIRIFKKC